MDNTEREAWIEGLRALADALTANPDLPLPYATGTNGDYDSDRLTWYADDRAQVQALVAALPGVKDKKVKDGSPHYGFELHGQIRGLHYLIAVDREKVCTRRVVAVREVEVPKAVCPVCHAPLSVNRVSGAQFCDAGHFSPETVTVTETVEDVEWDCHPLLAEATA